MNSSVSAEFTIMKTNRMLAFACVLAFGLLGGCRSGLTPLVRSDLEYERKLADGSGLRFRLRNPKDQTIGALVLDPAEGIVRLTNYASSVNAGVMRARELEAEQQRHALRDSIAGLREILGLVGAGMTGGAIRPGSPDAYPLSPPSVAPAAPGLNAAGPSPAAFVEGARTWGDYREYWVRTNAIPPPWLRLLELAASQVAPGSTNAGPPPEVLAGATVSGGYRQYWLRTLNAPGAMQGVTP